MDVKNTSLRAEIKCGELDVTLVHLGKVTSSQEAINELEKHGLRPANLQELLILRAKYPDKHAEYPVVAFGNIRREMYDCRNIPVLWAETERPGLNLQWFDTEWGDRCRFMGIKKRL